MKIILIFIICCMGLIQIIDSKKLRAVMSDKILDYPFDKTAEHHSLYFNLDNSWIEEIDDDKIMVGGYVECKKSMDPNLPIKASVRTQFMEQSIWREGPVRMEQVDLCRDFQIPDTLWYNVTKSWSPEFCPPQKGDNWVIANQTVTVILDVPPSTLVGPWRGYVLLTQGSPGQEKTKTGYGIQFELVEL